MGKIKFNPKPDKIKTDQWGQKVAYYKRESPPPGKFYSFNMTVKAKTYDTTFYVLPEKCGTLKDIPEDIKKKYLSDTKMYDIKNKIITDAVKAAVGNEKNTYWIMRKIMKYVIDHIQYELSGGWDPAPTVLQQMKGSCSEYSYVMIAMCRAAGLPARLTGATVQRGDEVSTDRVFHRWVEIYLPNYGWVPVDPNAADSPVPVIRSDAIGHVKNVYLITTIGGGDSNLMGWSYNFNMKGKVTGRPEIHMPTTCEWEPLNRKKWRKRNKR